MNTCQNQRVRHPRKFNTAPNRIQVHDHLRSFEMNRLSEETEEADYREFVKSITVTSDVMAVLLMMPEIASIAQAKVYLGNQMIVP